MVWAQATWATTLLPPASLGASEPDELTPLSASLLASWRIFQTIYATWVHSHLEMVAWAAITSCLMIHFYISLTRHPTSPARTGDTLLVFLITAIAIWIFHRMGASGPTVATHCVRGTGYREIKEQWWAERLGSNVERGTSWETGNLFPCNVSTKWSLVWWIVEQLRHVFTSQRGSSSAAFKRVWMMTWFPYTEAKGARSQNGYFYLGWEGGFRASHIVTFAWECWVIVPCFLMWCQPIGLDSMLESDCKT